jgi:hypothetical protein
MAIGGFYCQACQRAYEFGKKEGEREIEKLKQILNKEKP